MKFASRRALALDAMTRIFRGAHGVRCESRMRLANPLLLRSTSRATVRRQIMRVLLAGLLLAVTAACGGRKVDVKTGPTAVAGVTLQFTNNDNSAVNVY